MIDTDMIPDLPTHYHHTPDLPDCDLEFSADEDARITRAAQWGRSLLARAHADDQQALADLHTKMHMTRFEVTR